MIAGIFEIYVVTNLVNGRRYVGQTKNSTQTRWRHHSMVPRDRGIPEQHPAFSMADAIRKYGREAFQVEHVGSAKSRKDALCMEAALICQMQTTHPNGYNKRVGYDLRATAIQEMK